jgi:hypothetical protein
VSTVDSAAPTSANGRLAEGLSTVDSGAPTSANGRLAEGLSTVDSAARTHANGRLAEGLSTVDSAAPTHANGRLAPRRSQGRRGGGVSTKFVNALRRKRSGPTRDNSFSASTPLRQIPTQAEASPPDPHQAAVVPVLGGGGLAAPAEALPCPVSAADTNQFEPRALPCQGSLQVAEALGLRNVLPGRPRQGSGR